MHRSAGSHKIATNVANGRRLPMMSFSHQDRLLFLRRPIIGGALNGRVPSHASYNQGHKERFRDNRQRRGTGLLPESPIIYGRLLDNDRICYRGPGLWVRDGVQNRGAGPHAAPPPRSHPERGGTDASLLADSQMSAAWHHEAAGTDPRKSVARPAGGRQGDQGYEPNVLRSLRLKSGLQRPDIPGTRRSQFPEMLKSARMEGGAGMRVVRIR